MKITGVAIEQNGEAGVDVAVCFRWEHNEQFDMNDVGGVLAWLQLHGLCGDGVCKPAVSAQVEALYAGRSDITAEDKAVTANLYEAQDALDAARTKEKAATEAVDTAIVAVEAHATRRRKRNPLEVADAGAAPLSTPSDAPSQPADAPAAPTADATTGSATRRRRAAPADAPATTTASPETSSAPPPAATSPSEEAAPLRRRRAAPSAEGTPATTASPETTAASPEPGTRRRRAAAPVEPSPPIVEPVKETAPTPPASAPVASDGIPDAELSKAASRGAQMLTPAAVRAFVATFTLDDGTSCTSVNQIHPDDRRAFLDELAEKISAAQ